MTNRILALDTTAEFGSIALLEGAVLVGELLLHSPDGFGHILFPRIEMLLTLHGWTLDSVDCFAGSTGPGSFTGVRIGLAAVKGLAEGAGKRAIGVSSLEALAQCGSAPLRATVLDARRGEVYGALYSGALDPVIAETVMKFPAWLETLPDGEMEFVSADFAPFAAALKGTRFERMPVRTAPRALAAAVGQVARRRVAQDPAAIDANYVRRSDAELLWKER